MPESTSRSTSLDSFLPQFAPPGETSHAASATLNGHARSSPHALSNGSNGFVSQNGHGEANGHAALNLNGGDLDFVDETINGAETINGHSDCIEPDCDVEQAIYLDDELAVGFEELQAAAVDSVHGNADLAESLLPASDPLGSALASEPLLNGNGRTQNNEFGSHVSQPVAQIRETPADEIGGQPQAAELPVHIGETPSFGAVPSRNGAAPSSNGAVSPGLAGSASRPELEPHPATGSLFVPYLVTEIPHLRNRTARRRSWWRRLFG